MSRILVFANGEEVSAKTMTQVCRADDLIVCADGGAAHPLKHSIIPNLVVGDFDSLSSEVLEQLKAKNVEIRQFPSDKDQTDLELALDVAAEFNPSEVIIVNALGGRVDHLLGNIMLLTSFERFIFPISIVGDGVFITTVNSSHSLERDGALGDLFSLIPISTSVEGVCLTGAKWPLKNATLRRGRALTISNTFAENRINLSVVKGILLFIGA